jgi:uncharacterized protein
MQLSETVRLHRQEIKANVEQFHARNARIFGSVAAGNDTEESDLDLTDIYLY